MVPSIQLILILLLMTSGLVWIIVGIPLVKGTVPRNKIYGFRTPKTLSSDEIWYPANRFAGKELVQAGRRVFFGSLLLLASHALVGLTIDQVALFGTALTVVMLGIATLKGFIHLRTL
jgi:uncharacterized membrane protein